MEAISSFFQGWDISPADVAVLIGYMTLMMLVGYLCRKASANISDYIRLGNKGIQRSCGCLSQTA